MPLSLSALREHTPQPAPAEFLRWNPQCWLQFFDDTPAKDPTKARSSATIDPVTIERKQHEGCAVCFSLQAFATARTTDQLRFYRNMGIDIDLIRDPDGARVPAAEIDWRKDWYLEHCLFPFPLRPHWIIETRHGFQAVFHVTQVPAYEAALVREANGMNQRLVHALHGDRWAAEVTQLFQVPGCCQFMDPDRPFLCRLVYDAARLSPYTFDQVRLALDGWEATHGERGGEEAAWIGRRPDGRLDTWRGHLDGVPRGKCSPAACSIAGGIVCRLPQGLWEVAALGGLREWNRRNPEPLKDRDLRAAFKYIARRERVRRQHDGAAPGVAFSPHVGPTPTSVSPPQQ